VVDARTCESAEELTDLILASSATPPFTPVGRFRGQRLLDGGMIDNVPAFVADALPGVRRNLVLMTRPYHPSVVGVRGKRLYIAPTRETPISRWDYTSPELLDDTIRMGEREAEVHRPALDRFLGDD
jgi:predicted acylesterase/phospholipase RssA